MSDNKSLRSELHRVVTSQPLVAVAKQQERSQTVAQKGSGWQQLNAKMLIDRNWYIDFKSARDAGLAILRSKLISIPSDAEKKRIESAIAQIRSDAAQTEMCGIHVGFRNKQAVWTVLYFMFGPSALKNGTSAWLVASCETTAQAKQAVDYMMICRNTSSSLFSDDKTTCELVILPGDNKGLTQNDSQALLNILYPIAQLNFNVMLLT